MRLKPNGLLPTCRRPLMDRSGNRISMTGISSTSGRCTDTRAIWFRFCADGSGWRNISELASRTDIGTSWRATVGHDKPPGLCQYCHGAPGMVVTFADAPFESAEFETLLVEGGQFSWAAGPLAKGSNLCHGTGGNGYAFLKLYRRTKDPMWLERARAF